MVAGAGTGLQSAGGKPVAKIVNARSSGAFRQSSRMQELPEYARDDARGEGASGQGHEHMLVIPADTSAVLQIVLQGGTGGVVDRDQAGFAELGLADA